MNKIEKLSHAIRDLINSPWKRDILLKNETSWSKLCASLDTIEDVEIAIKEYKTIKDGTYLIFYGLLQGLFLQQGAIFNLNDALFGKKINFKTDYPDLFEIREIRNDSVGHPTNRKNSSFHVINRAALAKKHAQIIDYIPNGTPKTQNLDLYKIIEDQCTFIEKILKKVEEKLIKEYKNHKMKFKNKKLIDLIPSTFDYYISKIYEGGEFGKIHLRMILEIYNKIKKGVGERYPDTYAKDLFEKIDFILINYSCFTKKAKMHLKIWKL